MKTAPGRLQGRPAPKPPRPRRTARIAAAARGALLRMLRGGADFATRVFHKAGQDDIFFLAGGIAFNVLIAAVPFLLLLVAIFGYVLPAIVDDPQQAAVEYIISILPASREVIEYTRNEIERVIAGSTTAGIVGLVLFIWFSTRFVGSLRSALQDVFDLPEDRGIVQGKLFDAQMVLVAGTLFLLNTGITVAIEAIHTYGFEMLGVREGEELRALRTFYAQLLAFAFIFLMFVLMYRYLPARRIPWRAALVAATFTSIVWELLKAGFAWYIATFGNYASTYGVFATLIVLVFWIYYSAFVFVLGGEVGHVYELSRIRRRQRELLE